MPDSTTAAAIVAGGRARRFSGQDKGRLVVAGRTIIVRQVDALQRVASDVFVVGADPMRYQDLGLRVHADVIPEAGALGGIYTALKVAQADLVLTVACDLPFLDSGLLALLVARAVGHDGAWVNTDRGVEPLLACYRTDAARKIQAHIEAGQRRASSLGHILNLAVVSRADVSAFGPPDRLLTNVNSPEDYARVQYETS